MSLLSQNNLAPQPAIARDNMRRMISRCILTLYDMIQAMDDAMIDGQWMMAVYARRI